MDSIAEPLAKPKTKAVFDWADPFGLDAQLSEEERIDIVIHNLRY